MNPFKFGDPVEGEYYLPRPHLDKAVNQFLLNRIHVVLIGPRRFGKTSFVFNLLKSLEAEKYVCIFIDIFNITSHRDFLQQIIRAIRTKKNWVESAKKWFSNWMPKLSADIEPVSGQTSIGVSFEKNSEKDVKEMIQDMLAELANLGEKVVLVIDEFQKITELDDQGWLEATLRTHMQQLRNTSFLFTGSRKSLISDMLNNSSRPLYRSCQVIDFPSFGEEFIDWVVDRFVGVEIAIKREAVSYLKTVVQDTPNYVQMICFHLVAAGYRNQIGRREVEETLRRVVRQNAYAYQTLLNSLSPLQQRVLRLAARENKQIFAKELLNKYEIPSSPALSSSIKALKGKGILDEEGTGKGQVIFDDPLFAIWLKEVNTF